VSGRKIAVIGGGISGLTAAYILARTDEVTVFEAGDRLGGHADTHLVPEPGEPPVPVDTGFIVYNERTYPLLTRMFRELGVMTQASEMGMSVSCSGCGVQYAGQRGLAGLGAVACLTGFACETVGDRQLAQFRANPANRGQIMDRGLWRYTRHPNYFGDACMWWGIFLISYGSPLQLVTLVSPLLMTFILTRGTGQRMTERRMSGSRPGYAEYVRRTSGFIPLPPRRPRRPRSVP
jgi:protein-S-isoprenylcysteine O-methyltransferase Ste14